MLRHACRYALASRGHDTTALQAYLGHKNIQPTVRYTERSPTRFSGEKSVSRSVRGKVFMSKRSDPVRIAARPSASAIALAAR